MTEQARPPQDIDEEVDRAVQAVRAGPASRSLPPDVRAALVAKMEAAARHPPRLRLLELVAARRLRPVVVAAASVLITAASLAVIFGLLGRPGVAFAEVKEAIQQAQTIQMTVESVMGQGPNAVRMRMKMRIKAPGLVRMETDTGESVVADAAQRIMLTVEPARRRAMLIDIPELPDRTDTSPRNILERMRQVLDGSERCLGRRQIDGQSAQGFTVTKGNRQMEIWAEESTGQIVLIKLDVHMEGMPPTHMILRDIVLNADMPDALFHLAPPEGFTLENHAKNLGTPGEQDLAEGLRDLAGWNRGVFPEQLQPSVEMARIIEEKLAPLPESDRAAKVHRLTRMVFFAALRYDQDFHYAGGGVKLGEPSKPIAWWKPKDAKTYRVLMGDLTFQDRPPEKLPSTANTSDPQARLRDEGAELAALPACGVVEITFCDSEAVGLANATGLTTGMTLTATVKERATETSPAGSKLRLARSDADAHAKKVTRNTPAGS